MDLRKHTQMLNDNTFKVNFFFLKEFPRQGGRGDRVVVPKEQHKPKPGCEASERNQNKLGVAGAYEMVRNLVWAAA